MLLVLEFSIYIILISFWLYSLLDKFFLCTNQGGKIGKYIKKYNLTNIASNFEQTKKISILNFFLSPNGSKYFFKSIFATIAILAIKLAFTYNFLFSKVYIISIFQKRIDLANIFDESFIIFKILYYLSSYVVYLVFILKLIYYKNSSKKEIEREESLSKDTLIIGSYNDKKLGIYKQGLYQNILITGSIGSGKTSTAITTIFRYFVKNNICGLVLDVKGNYVDTVKKVMKSLNSNLKLNIVALNNGIYNPIDIPHISAFELASRIKKCLEILSEKNSSDSYWLDKAASYIKDFIVLIRTYNDYVSFLEIHKLCIDNEYLNNKIEEVKNIVMLGKLSENKVFEINNSITNIKNEYMMLDTRTKNIIRSEITRMTDVFVSDYNVCQRFCSKNEKNQDFFNSITVLSINIGENPKISKILATYLKLNFESEVLRASNKEDKFLLCDEYQEFCNEDDAHFFSLSREYKCINVVAMQSYSSLKNTLNNEAASNVIIQNFVNKIWFRNDDVYTIGEIVKQLGKEEKRRTNISVSENSQESKYNIFSKNFKNNKSGITESYNISENLEERIDSSYFSSYLKTFEAVCILSDGLNSKLYKKVRLDMWKEGE